MNISYNWITIRLPKITSKDMYGRKLQNLNLTKTTENSILSSI